MKHRELAVRFGRSSNLVGVLTQPVDAPQGPAPAVLLLSAGVVHSAGPFGMYVALARALAELGFPVLRFDLAGIGDSTQPRDARTVKERTIDDVTDAMDFLARRLGVHEFVVGGLCSAADDAHALTRVDDRIVANIMLDGYAYPTLRFRSRQIADKFAPASLLPRARDRVARMLRRSGARKPLSPAPQIAPRPFPAQAVFRREMRANLARGVQVLCVFSGGVDYYNYQGQFRRCLGLAPEDTALTERYLPEAEHTYPLLGHRRRMIEWVSRWLDERFGRGRTETGPEDGRARSTG